MKLLVDTDVFCKLGIAGLLDDAAQILGVELSECGRLAALPHMLRKGRLRDRFGAEACDALVPIAEAVPVIPKPTAWLDVLTLTEGVDPGEAQLFAAAAEFGLAVVTGDKRALRAISHIKGLPEALDGRIWVLEAVLIVLCDEIGVETLRQRVSPLAAVDTTVRICFSPESAEPRAGLLSFYMGLATEVEPLVLRTPQKGDGV